MRTRVKICGVTRPEDAALAARLGADAIGLIFHPPAGRNVAVARAREIVAALPAFATPVGLFVDAPTRTILDVAEELRLTHVQLHGHETPEQVAELKGLAVTKAVRVARGTFEGELAAWRAAIERLQLGHLRGFVLETAGPGVGGTGVANDWAYIAERQRAGALEGLPALIAAGGLRVETVAEVVRTIRPYAVDVSSGVESMPGQKSAEKLQAFIAAVQAAG